MTFHIIRPWRNTKIFRVWKLFCSTPLTFAIQTWFCNCPQYLYLFHIICECIPSIHDPGKMLVLPNQLLCWVVSTSDQCFVPFQPFLCHPQTQIRTNPFHDVQRDIPNLESSPSHVSIGFSQIAFPLVVLPKDDRTDSVQEERLDLPHWTMIWAICVLVDVSKYLDILTGFFQQFVSILHFNLGISWYCVCCLSIATWQSGDDIHDVGGGHLWCWWSLFSKYCLWSCWNLGSNSEFLRWQMSINDTRCTVLPSFLVSSITSFFVSDLRQLPCRYFPEFFQISVHYWYFHCFKQRINLRTITSWPPFLQCDLHDLYVGFLPNAFS